MRLRASHLEQVLQHAARAYPAECFGFLVGESDQGGVVHQVVAGHNRGHPHRDRFEMDPEQFVAVDHQAEAAGWEVIGFYHSHPDWPAVPSQADLDMAWEHAYYLIVSVRAGRPHQALLWRLAADPPRRFAAQALEIEE